MSNKPKGTWNYVPSENEQKDTWNSVSRPKTEQEVAANNTALEDWYRAQQNGDPNAGQYLMNASVAKADVDRWKHWREQNKTQLDTEYAFKGLDQDVLSLVRDKFKSQWGTKYYYDMFDTEDAFRAQSGRMPKYAEKSYDFSDPYDQWLYQNDLPSRKSFSDMYSQAAFDYNKEQTEHNAIVDGIVNDWNGYVDQYGKFQRDYFGAVNAAAAEKGGELTDAEMEEITSRMLTSGKYDGIAGGFTVPEDESEKSALEIYLEGLDAPDYSAYDAMLAALQDKKGIDDAFFDAYKESDYRKWMAGKTAFTQQDLTDAYRRSVSEAEAKLYTDYAEAAASGDTADATEKLGRIKTKVEDELQAGKWEKANALYTVLMAKPIMGSSPVDLKEATFDDIEDSLRKEMRRKQYSDKEIEEYIGLRRQEEAVAQDEQNLQQQEELAKSKKTADEMAEAAEAAMSAPGYVPKTVEGDAEFRGESWQEWVDELVDENASGFKRLWQSLIQRQAGRDMGKYEARYGERDFVLDTPQNPKYYVQRYMTEDERAVLNYYRTEKGDDKAREYLEALMPTLYARDAETAGQMATDIAGQSPLVASLLPTVTQLQTAAEGFQVGIEKILSGENPVVNDPRMRTSRMNAEMRSSVMADMSPAGQFFYETGMSILDNLARLPMGKAGLGMMAGSVMSQRTDQALQNGATPEQALALGTAAALIEVVTEKVSLDRILNPKMAGSAKQIVMEVLKQAGVEASEEMASEVLNTMADVQIMQGDSEWEQAIAAYMAEDPTMTRQQAEAKVFGDKTLDVLLSGAGGFLSGGIMGGGSTMLANYNAGLNSGGNALNALSVGTKAVAQYEQDAKTAQKVGAGIQAQVLEDISALGLKSEEAQAMIDTTSRLAEQPTSWMPAAAIDAYGKFSRMLNDQANHARTINTEYNAKQTQAKARLQRMYDGVQAAYSEAAAAIESGDLRAHSAALQKAQAAMEAYQTQYETAQAENEVQTAKRDEQLGAVQNKVKDAYTNVSKAEAEATAYQAEMAARIDAQLVEQEKSRISVEPVDTANAGIVGQAMASQLGDIMDNIVTEEAEARVSKMTDDEKRSAIYDMIYGQQEAAMESGDAEAYKAAEAAKDEYDVYYESIKNNGQSAADGDTIMEEMVGGAENETVQKEGAENEAETDGRGNRISRAEPVRGADEKRSEQKDHRSGGIEEKRGAQGDVREVRRSQRKKARGAVSWGEQQDADVRNAVAAFNRKNGTNLSPDSVREAQSVPKTIREIAEVARGITGRGSFFIESDRGMFGGFNTGKRPYIVLSGDTTMDAFNLFHEHAHNIPQLLNAISSMLRDGWISKREYNAYKNSRKRRRAANLGIPVSEVSEESEQTIRTEFACDMLGVYAMEAFCNEDHWSAYGIDAETIGSIKQTLDDALAANAITETDAGAVEREFSTLEEAGRAITEAEAKGETDYDRGEPFRFSENWTEVYPSSSIEYKNRNEYSPYMQKTIIEYLSSVDPKIVQFVNSVLSGNDPKPISLKPISEELGNDIAQILGWNPTGFKAELDAKQVRHLRQDHGLGGVKLAHAADMTMSDSNDVARIQYIIDTYDVVQFGGLTRAYSEPRNDGTDRPRRAETIVIGKRVDSMFYVVEAIPNTAAKTVKFVTSFMQTGEDKNKGAIPLPDAENAPRSTSKNESEPTPTIIIKDREDEFNRKNQNFSNWISFDDGSFSFSENAPTKKQERLKKAWELFDDGAAPQDYYVESRGSFDLKTNNLLRGLMLRNGKNVGGALADNSMQRVTEIFSRAKKRRAAGLSLSSPVRVFEDVTGWGGSTAEERANNIKDGNFLKNTYYEYGNVQAANREAWIAEKMRTVMEAIAQNGDYGVFESAVTQMLGEGIITKDQAENAVCDGKTMIIEAVDGVFVLDGKGRMLYSSDSRSAIHYIDMPIAKRAENAIRKKSKGELAKHVVKRELPPLKVVRDGNTVTVKKDNGEVVAQVAGGMKPNMQAVHAAVDALRTFYADAYKEIAAARVENGYAPPGYIENYFPHQSRTYDGIEGFIEAMTANDLPTAINGRTGMFSPGQPWNANLQSRLGEFTEFDAVRGFNRYVKGAGDTIFYTPVIQRLRQLEKAVRMLDETQLTAEGQKRNSAFADWVHEYANEWANKKASFDREVESLVGREGYSVSNMLTGLVSASAVGGNISSALSNIISGLTGYAQIDAKYTVPEIVRTVGQLFQLLDKKGQYDGFADKIPFLKRRFSDNEDILIQNMDKLKRNGSKALYAMFSAIDRFAVESVARAKYSECVANGMTDVQAIAATNDMLIKNFADRGKGQAARIFNVKWLKPVAQFQLEVLNQMNHFRDMNRAEVEAKLYDLEKQYANGIPFDEIAVKALSSGGMRKLKKVMAYLVLLSLWGMVTRALMGRDQTWNPYGMAKDLAEDFQEGGLKQAGEGLKDAVVDNAPFLSMLSGGGRVPIAGNLANVTNIVETLLNGGTLSDVDFVKAGTAFVPGGGQFRKSYQGAKANAERGKYTNDGRLQYPVTEDDFWKTILFGASAAQPSGYAWGDTLSKKETEVYRELVSEGYDEKMLYDTLVGYGGSTNAERALSLLANRNDFTDAEIDLIAEMVGLNYSGSLERYAEKESKRYLRDKERELESGKIQQERFDAIANLFDEYFRLLGMDN